MLSNFAINSAPLPSSNWAQIANIFYGVFLKSRMARITMGAMIAAVSLGGPDTGAVLFRSFASAHVRAPNGGRVRLIGRFRR